MDFCICVVLTCVYNGHARVCVHLHVETSLASFVFHGYSPPNILRQGLSLCQEGKTCLACFWFALGMPYPLFSSAGFIGDLKGCLAIWHLFWGSQIWSSYLQSNQSIYWVIPFCYYQILIDKLKNLFSGINSANVWEQ